MTEKIENYARVLVIVHENGNTNLDFELTGNNGQAGALRMVFANVIKELDEISWAAHKDKTNVVETK